MHHRSTKKVGIKSNCTASTVDVNTVDSFQGREKDIIVISCVRASSQAEENLVGVSGSSPRYQELTYP